MATAPWVPHLVWPCHDSSRFLPLPLALPARPTQAAETRVQRSMSKVLVMLSSTGAEDANEAVKVAQEAVESGDEEAAAEADAAVTASVASTAESAALAIAHNDKVGEHTAMAAKEVAKAAASLSRVRVGVWACGGVRLADLWVGAAGLDWALGGSLGQRR